MHEEGEIPMGDAAEQSFELTAGRSLFFLILEKAFELSIDTSVIGIEAILS